MSRFTPSHRFSDLEPGDLVLTCNVCGCFYARCPVHPFWSRTCHRNRVVFTDGACSNNGRFGARAGVGVAFGVNTEDEYEYEETHRFSLPVDDFLDPDGRRSSQRAELLAALEGLRRVCYFAKDQSWISNCHHAHHDASSRDWIIIATDSKYVVSGMTEWLPKWKENGFMNSRGQQPANLDLFCKLEEEIEEQEDGLECEVKFWHIDREYNQIADELAKSAIGTDD